MCTRFSSHAKPTSFSALVTAGQTSRRYLSAAPGIIEVQQYKTSRRPGSYEASVETHRGTWGTGWQRSFPPAGLRGCPPWQTWGWPSGLCPRGPTALVCRAARFTSWCLQENKATTVVDVKQQFQLLAPFPCACPHALHAQQEQTCLAPGLWFRLGGPSCLHNQVVQDFLRDK